MFVRSFRTQFYIMIRQLGFRFCFMAVLLMGLINTELCLLLNFIGNFSGIKEDMMDASEAFLLNDYSPVVDKFFLISLFLVLCPYCFSTIKNRNLHIDLLHIVRGDIRSYYAAGAATAFCGTFLAFFLPLLIELLCNQMFFLHTGRLADGFSVYGLNGGGRLTGVTIDESMVVNPGFCLIPIGFYIRHPLFYNVLYAFLYSVFMAILALMMYAFSLYFKKNSYLFFPLYILYFLILRIGHIVYTITGERMIDVDFFCYFRVGNNMNLSYVYISLLTICIIIMSIVLIYRKAVSDQGVA